MENERDKIINRVRKMLNLANDAGASEGERDNAMRMAHKLMLKHNIDSLQIEQQRGPTSKEARVEKQFEFYGRPWARNVAYNVARLFFCSYLYRSKYKSKITEHCFIGRESNAITAGEVARFVVESISKEAKRKQRENYADNDWYRSFCWGAANSIRRRVNEMIIEATKPTVETPNGPEPEVVISRSMALAVVDHYKNEEVENQSLISSLYPKLAKARAGKGIGNADARNRGAEYGNSVSLSRQVGDGRVKGQLK